MMQKNLSCRNIAEAKKNMYWFSLSLIPVKLLLLSLGLMLLVYAGSEGISLPERADDIFPFIATQGYLPSYIAVFFIVGLVAATYSSADSSLTALTTSFTIDILNAGSKEESGLRKTRKIVHLAMALFLGLIIVIFRAVNNQSVISTVFTVAGYTYGPLLGMYSFGIFTGYRVKDKYVPWIAAGSPGLTYFLVIISENLFIRYNFGYEVLLINGLISFLGLMMIRERRLNRL